MVKSHEASDEGTRARNERGKGIEREEGEEEEEEEGGEEQARRKWKTE